MLFLFSGIRSVRNNFVSVGKRDRITRFLRNKINVCRKKEKEMTIKTFIVIVMIAGSFLFFVAVAPKVVGSVMIFGAVVSVYIGFLKWQEGEEVGRAVVLYSGALVGGVFGVALLF
jgi:hypothetical protein